jgi:hypothetical protein
MKALLATLTLAMILPYAANASVFVTCGEGKFDEKAAEFPKPVVAISSGDDAFRGPVGGTWEMKFGKGDAWIAKNKNITAKTRRNEVQGTVVTITVVKDQGLSPVGYTLEFSDIYSETPKMEKFELGGFAGGMKTQTLDCVSMND